MLNRERGRHNIIDQMNCSFKILLNATSIHWRPFVIVIKLKKDEENDPTESLGNRINLILLQKHWIE